MYKKQATVFFVCLFFPIQIHCKKKTETAQSVIQKTVKTPVKNCSISA